MDHVEFPNFEKLSPFENMGGSIKVAKQNSRITRLEFLNAGRSNPKWIVTTWRESFFRGGIAPAVGDLRRHSIFCGPRSARSSKRREIGKTPGIHSRGYRMR